MAIPNEFNAGGEGTLINYTWTDMIGNVGYKRFYGGCAQASGATTYFLAANEPDDCTGIAAATMGYYTSSATSLDLDFDTSAFQTPFTVASGAAIINFSRGAHHDITISGVVRIYHVRGATETLIGWDYMLDKPDSEDTDHDYRELMKINVNKTRFKKGDILRLNMVLSGGDAAAKFVRLWHSSAMTMTDNNGVTGRSCNLTLDIPFKVDL